MKKSKELDDNNPTKNDRKDPKVIAGLIKEGHYMIPYLPDGVYTNRIRACDRTFLEKTVFVCYFLIVLRRQLRKDE